MEITKEGAQILLIKMRNVELYLKEVKVIYRFHPHERLERLDCSHLFNSEHRSKISTDYTSGERSDWKLFSFTSLIWPEIATKRESISTLHVSVDWAFLQKKLLFINRDSSIGILCLYFAS